EDGPEGLEWESAERHLSVGAREFGEQTVWLVSDDRGRVVDRSKQPGVQRFLAAFAEALSSGQSFTEHFDWHGERWKCSKRRVQATMAAADKRSASPPSQNDEGHKYSALQIAVAVSLEPATTTLRGLATVLFGLSVGIWLLALFAGRFVCDRALLPVTRMG